MSPRPYHSEQRKLAVDETRRRVIEATHALLSGAEGARGFSIDSVARAAGVARMTVYYQFGSKSGLMEALFDDMSANSLRDGLAKVFAEPGPERALDLQLAAFSHFFTVNRMALRRISALAVLDPELESALEGRNRRRRATWESLASRLREARGLSPDVPPALVATLFAVSGFPTFDTIAGVEREPSDVTETIALLVRAVLAAM